MSDAFSIAYLLWLKSSSGRQRIAVLEIHEGHVEKHEGKRHTVGGTPPAALPAPRSWNHP